MNIFEQKTSLNMYFRTEFIFSKIYFNIEHNLEQHSSHLIILKSFSKIISSVKFTKNYLFLR